MIVTGLSANVRDPWPPLCTILEIDPLKHNDWRLGRRPRKLAAGANVMLWTRGFQHNAHLGSSPTLLQGGHPCLHLHQLRVTLDILFGVAELRCQLALIRLDFLAKR